MASHQGWTNIENQVSHYFVSTHVFRTPTAIAQRCTFLKYTLEIVSAVHRLQAMASHQEWNDVENYVSNYLMLTDLSGTPTPIAQRCTFYNIRLKCRLPYTGCKLWPHIRDGMTSKIKYPTILCSQIYSELAPNSTTVQIL